MEKPDCKKCPTAEVDRFRKRGLAVRQELRRHHLSDRERHIAEVILDKSLGWGRESVIIPQLRFFTNLTGIGVSHVHEALRSLHNMRIIRAVTVKGQSTYSIREDSDNWKVKPRVSFEVMADTVSLLRELNDLPRNGDPLENFKARTVVGKTPGGFPDSGIPDGFPHLH